MRTAATPSQRRGRSRGEPPRFVVEAGRGGWRPPSARRTRRAPRAARRARRLTRRALRVARSASASASSPARAANATGETPPRVATRGPRHAARGRVVAAPAAHAEQHDDRRAGEAERIEERRRPRGGERTGLRRVARSGVQAASARTSGAKRAAHRGERAEHRRSWRAEAHGAVRAGAPEHHRDASIGVLHARERSRNRPAHRRATDARARTPRDAHRASDELPPRPAKRSGIGVARQAVAPREPGEARTRAPARLAARARDGRSAAARPP